jgi:hypothetical protein
MLTETGNQPLQTPTTRGNPLRQIKHRDRCYDFLNIFEKFGGFDSKQS